MRVRGWGSGEGWASAGWRWPLFWLRLGLGLLRLGLDATAYLGGAGVGRGAVELDGRATVGRGEDEPHARGVVGRTELDLGGMRLGRRAADLRVLPEIMALRARAG